MSTNWAAHSVGATLAVTRSNGSIDYNGASLIYDGDQVSWTNFLPAATMTNESITYTITLPVTINLASIWMLSHAKVNTGSGYDLTLTLAYYDGTWHNVGSTAMLTSFQHYTPAAVYAPNVTRVRAVVSGITRSGTGGAGDPITYSKGYLGELMALGDDFQDKGLRFYDGSSVRKIAVTTLSASSRIRVSIGGTTYEVPTVEITHGLAAKVRVKIPGYSSGRALVDIT